MKSGINIRFARTDDELSILNFLNQHWKHDHIFVTNPELMRWQHRSPTEPETALTFVIAENTTHNDGVRMMALLGYIPFKRFDTKADWTELALAIWKIRDDAKVPGLGLHLLRFLDRELSPSMICAIGISDIVKPIYKALGYQLGTLQHAAIFPTTKAATKIASGVPEYARLPVPSDVSLTLQALSDADLLEESISLQIDSLGQHGLPRKSCDYVRERYCEHPWYQYSFRLVSISNMPEGLIVWRQVAAQGTRILRIVDVIGDPEVLCYCSNALRKEVESEGCEYLDVVFHGIDSERLRKAGFVDTTRSAGLVLPNYFSPFERKNVKVDFAFKKSKEFMHKEVHFFRADSDQDRPNSTTELYARGA